MSLGSDEDAAPVGLGSSGLGLAKGLAVECNVDWGVGEGGFSDDENLELILEIQDPFLLGEGGTLALGSLGLFGEDCAVGEPSFSKL